jgi:hypothetical protein
MKTLRILAATLVALSAAACGSGSGPTDVPAASARDAARLPPASRNELPGDTSAITTARNPGIGSGAGFIQGDTVPPLTLPSAE